MDKRLVEKIIFRFGCCAGIKSINLIDQEGVIISSCSSEQTGETDKSALFLLKSGKESEIFRRETGEAEGYFVVPEHSGKIVIRVSDTYEKVSSIFPSLKLSFQMLTEYQALLQAGTDHGSRKERFLALLFHQEPFDLDAVRSLSEELQIKEELVRVPVLIDIHDRKDNTAEVQRLFLSNKHFSEQDLLEVSEEGELILYKSVDCPGKKFMQEYKYILAEALSELLHHMRSRNIKYNLYFGPAQDNYSTYRQAWKYCKWMQKNIKSEGSFYFYDHVVKYLESEASFTVLESIFGILRKQMGKKLIENYKELMEILIDKEYNLIRASESLYIHKNTLVYRLDKIRELLNMNPLNFNADREFMEGFYIYLKRFEE